MNLLFYPTHTSGLLMQFVHVSHIQLPTCIYVVTEEATPLEDHLKCQEGYSDFSIAWGLHQTIVSATPVGPMNRHLHPEVYT